MNHFKSILMFLAIPFIFVTTTSAYEVSVGKNCSNYPINLKEQAFGFDLSNFNVKGPYLKNVEKTKPVLKLTCNNPQQWNGFTIPDHFFIKNYSLGPYRANSDCLENTEALQRHIYEKVELWEKYPLGSFETTNENRSPDLPSTARCLISVMNEMYNSKAMLISLEQVDPDYLDPEFLESYNNLPNSEKSNPGAYTDFIKSYGTHFWKYGDYGNGIHVYVLTAEPVNNGTNIVSEAIRTYSRESGLSIGDWIKQKFESAVVLLRHTGTDQWSLDNVNLVDGQHKTLNNLFVDGPKADALERAIAEYLGKAGFKRRDKYGDDWEFNDKKSILHYLMNIS